MLARLWWKEWRGNWPLLAAVAGLAAGVQWLALESGIWEVRTGVLTILALGFAVMYAFAIGSASFAGERENRSLGWLDTLPVGRRMLWSAKASFALASTAALALALVILAAAGTETRDDRLFALRPLAIDFGVLLIEALAWGFFWSAMLSQVLPAAVLALATVGLILAAASGRFGLHIDALSETAALRLVLAMGALAASWVVMTRRPRPGRRPRVDRPSRLKDVRPVESEAIPAAKARPPRASKAPTPLRALIWETWREARRTWGIIAGVSVLVPIAAMVLPGGQFNLVGFALVGGCLASPIAGTCVFAAEDRARTYRFYLQMGVRPSTVWLAKQAVWIALMLLVWAPLLAMCHLGNRGGGTAPPLSALVLIFTTGFAAGQLCEMVFRRAIVAAVFAAVLTIALLMPQSLMVSAQLLPEWWLGFTPSILLVASWAWSGDWLDDRPGLGRWARLALHLAVPYGLLGAAYIDYRARSVPDVEPPFTPADLKVAPIPVGANAADTYTLAIARLGPRPAQGSAENDKWAREIQRVIAEGWDPDATQAVAWWRTSQRAIELARRASAMEQAEFEALDHLALGSAFSIGTYLELQHLADALALDARERQARGDLAGAWEDIRALIRMAGHITQRPIPSYMAGWFAPIEHRAVQVGIGWAADPRQDPARLRAALDDLGRLPELPKPTAGVMAEYVVAQRALDNPAKILSWFFPVPSGRLASPYQAALHLLIAGPWEIERARRVVKLTAAEQLQRARAEAWRRPPARCSGLSDLHWPPGPGGRTIKAEDLLYYEQGTPLSRYLMHDLTRTLEELDREAVLRRALTQVIALRVWKLEHGGRDADRLADLVPSVLERLPNDPYSPQPFGYVRSKGQPVTTIKLGGGWSLSTNLGPVPTRPGQWLLYSIGPDGVDNRATNPGSNNGNGGDLVIPLPEAGPAG